MRQHVLDDVVITRHPPETESAVLAARLAATASDPIRTLFAAPLSPEPVVAPDGSFLSFTPRTDDLGDDERPPWREAGALLARLHACPLPDGLPEHTGRNQLADAVAAASRLHPGGPTDILRELGQTLLATWPEPVRVAPVHSRFDLRALGRAAGTNWWLLKGPYDLGVGQPEWDLARPAGLWAAGLLDEASWFAFMGGYASAGGVVPGQGQAWPTLDHPSRCAVFMAAVAEVGRSGSYPKIELTWQAEALLAACRRLNGRPW